MPMSNRSLGRLLVLAAALFGGRLALAQDAPPPGAPAKPADEAPKPPEVSAQKPEEPSPPWRPPEGSLIIDLPSAVSNPDHSLQLLITHRFADYVHSDIHNFFTFFSAASVGLGLSYVPVHNLETGFLRAQGPIEDYEVFAKYGIYTPAAGPFSAAVRLGGDFRTEPFQHNRASFFAQGILALTVASRVRISVEPTFSTWAVGPMLPKQENVFNVLGAVSVAVTRTFNVHGEIVPRAYGSPGTGWIASIEKTVLRHRFSFTVGNLRGTTVDQYVIWQPTTFTDPGKVYFGFNIVRLWSLK
jgi:uncharacterized beta barrel domain-containing protein DUF5777